MDPFQKIFMEGLASRAALYEKHDEGFMRMTQQPPTQTMIENNSVSEKLRSLDLIKTKIDNLKLENYFRERIGARGNIVFRPEALKIDLQKIVDSLTRVWSDATGDKMRAQYREPMTSLLNKLKNKIRTLIQQGDQFLKTERDEYNKLRRIVIKNTDVYQSQITRSKERIRELEDSIYNEQFQIYRAQQALEEAQRDENDEQIMRLTEIINRANENIERMNREIVLIKEKVDDEEDKLEKGISRAKTDRFVDFTEKVKYDFENLKSELDTNIIPDINNLLTSVESYMKQSIQAQQFASGQLKFDER